MSALLLSAVLGAGGKAGIALSANHFLALEGLGKGGKGGIKHTTAETEDQVEGRFLLNVVVATIQKRRNSGKEIQFLD